MSIFNTNHDQLWALLTVEAKEMLIWIQRQMASLLITFRETMDVLRNCTHFWPADHSHVSCSLRPSRSPMSLPDIFQICPCYVKSYFGSVCVLPEMVINTFPSISWDSILFFLSWLSDLSWVAHWEHTFGSVYSRWQKAESTFEAA